ncbi:MAG: polysaccharide biosynthesis C-terminal domain-containing protein [Chitinophagaceae bacterium]|nr:polysaccharide biosynthesis C-terminal domain-containing protein [Chitinophagaceae bacterium]
MHAAKVLWQSMVWRGLYYISAFVINIVIARHFEAAVSGAVYYLGSIYALILLVSSLSLESGIIYFAAKKEIPATRLFNFSIVWSLFTGLMSFLIIFYFFYEDHPFIPKTLLLYSSVLYISGNLLITYCSGFFYADNNFKIPSIVIIAGTLILVILIPYGGRSIVPAINNENYFYVYFGSYFVQGLCLAIATKLKYIQGSLLQFLSRAEYKMLLRYCGLAFTGNLIFFLLYRIDYFFVEKYCTADELGNYIQVSKLVHLFFILPTILASAVFPMTAGGHKEKIHILLTLLSRTIFFVYLLITAVLAITGSWLFPFVFGESFTAMYQPFLFLIPGILALSGIFTVTAYFAGRNQIGINITGSLLALVVILIGDIFFVPAYGINAAAMISSMGYIVYQVYIIFVFRKEYPCSVANFFIFRRSDWKQIRHSVSLLRNKENENKQ